jgi:histidinol-phosphate aminotransferase
MDRYANTTPPGTRAFRPRAAVTAMAPPAAGVHAALSLPHRERIAKLDENEAVRPPSPRVRRALTDYAAAGELNWYPDEAATALRAALADYTGAGSEWIRVFSDTDAALMTLACAFLEPDDEVVWSPPTDKPFRECVEAVGGVPVPAPVLSIWEAEPGAVLTAITPRTRLVYLANPNNPTGTLYAADQIAALLWACPDVGFVIDETYYEFSGATAASLLLAHANLLIVRSFSPAFGLAGLRIGYVLSHPSNLAWLDRIRTGTGCSVLAQVAAGAALADQEYLRATVAETRLAMKMLTGGLVQTGLAVRTTAANFLLTRVHDPDAVWRFLANRLIFVGNCNRIDGLSGHLRIAVGDTRTAERVVEAFRAMPSALLFPAAPERRRVTLDHAPEALAGRHRVSMNAAPMSRHALVSRDH